MKCKVSIIIPVFNVQQYIEKSFRSVLNQTYKNLEIIFIDDCTQDNSIEIIRDIIFVEKLDTDLIKIVKHVNNKGLSAARNTGINVSTGDYLYFLDSDDFILNTCIEKLVCNLDVYKNIDFVIGGVKSFGEKRFEDPLLNKIPDVILNNNSLIRSHFVKNNWYVMAWNKLISKKFIIDNDLYFNEGIVYEDSLWSFEVACKACSIAICKDITYMYFIRNNSITSLVSPKNIYSRLYIAKSMLLKAILDGDLKLINYAFASINGAIKFAIDNNSDKNGLILFQEEIRNSLKLSVILKLSFKTYLRVLILYIPYNIQRRIFNFF